MMHEQLISRNRMELSEVVASFMDLNNTYHNDYSLYLDQNGWEVFDLRCGRSIIRHEFKHFNHLISDMKRMSRALLDAFSAYSRLCRSQKPKPGEIWSIKFLLNYYDLDDEDLFHPLLKSYIENGLTKKKQALADRD